MTASAHSWESVPAWTAWFVTPEAHLTYAPWLLKLEQGHCWAICARVAATACTSPGLSPQAAKVGWAAPTRRAITERVPKKSRMCSYFSLKRGRPMHPTSEAETQSRLGAQ